MESRWKSASADATTGEATTGSRATASAARGDSEGTSLDLLGDDAIETEADDRLGRLAFADRMAQLLDNVARQTNSAVFGLIGPWGSGKTSVLNLVRNQVDARDEWEVVEFNPWLVSNLESLVREFLLTVMAPLPSESTARNTLAEYANKVAPLTSALSVVGVDPSNAVKGLANLIEGDRSLEARRKAVEQALQEQEKRIVVLLDDVDRLQVDELALLLKMVRLVGRLPHLYYILAYDEETLLDVLGATDVGAEKQVRALAYLDKIIQVRLDLPPVTRPHVGTLVEDALGQITDRYNIELTADETERLSLAYHDHLAPVLTEPRHVKRFFGQMDAVYALVYEEVDFVDFVLTTFLRTFYPSVYRLLRRHKEELTGTKLELLESPSLEERLNTWRGRIAEAGLSEGEAESLLSLLGTLFSPLARYGSIGTQERAQFRGVGSAEYFDRYFYLAVPPDDFPDRDVRRSLEEFVRGEPATATSALLNAMPTAAEAIIDKVRRFAPRDPSAARRLIPFAGKLTSSAPEGGFLGRPRIAAEFFLFELLEHADLSEPSAVLQELLSTTDLRNVSVALRRMEEKASERGQTLTQDQHDLHGLVVQELRGSLDDKTQSHPSELEGVVELLVHWAALTSGPEVRGWLHQVLDSSAWSSECFVALFVPLLTSARGQSFGDMDLTLVEDLVGIDFLLEKLRPEVDHESFDWDSNDVSFERRKQRALAILSREASKRANEPGAPENS